MSPPLSRREALALCSTVGAGLLAGCQGSSISAPAGDGDPEGSLGLSYFTSGWSRADDAANHGWVHVVSHGESADLTFDVRFCAALDLDEVELRGAGGTEYELAFETDGDARTTTPSESASTDPRCDPGEQLVGGGNVPNDWERLAVTVDGTEVAAIERSGTGPELRPLPDPVRPA